MLTFLKGQEQTATILRSAPSVTLSSCTVYDPSDRTNPCTATVANDDTDTTISTSAERNAMVIISSGLTAGHQYYITDTTGKTLTVHVIGVSGTTCTLRDSLPYGLNSGATVKGIEASYTFTIPSTYDQDSVAIDLLMSNGDLMPDEIIASKYRFFNPIDSTDLYTRWTRIRGNEPSYQKSRGVEWQPQIDRAVDMIRDKFWRDGHVMDRIRSPQLVSELIVIQTGLIIVNMGYDLSASSDASETRRDLQSQLKAAYLEVLGATNLWRDENEDGVKQAEEVEPIGIKLVW